MHVFLPQPDEKKDMIIIVSVPFTDLFNIHSFIRYQFIRYIHISRYSVYSLIH